MKQENNFLTYLKWRGDLSVRERPFNEIDALILSELAYIRFENIVPEIGEAGSVTVREANEKYIRTEERDVLYYKRKEQLLETLANCPRFSEMTLSNYISTYDETAHQQFAAMHIKISPALTFIAFRGTDSSIVGWREDFNMSFMMPVPAQQSAVEYVNKTATGMFQKYWLGGHSKGGNLAIYSAVFCDAKVQKKILRVNSFDGPGFNRNVVTDAAYQRIKDKIHAYVPVSSVVGMLMEHAEDYKVVESKEASHLQHEGFSWEVSCDRFVLVDELDPFSKRVGFALKNWLDEMSAAERKALVDAFFQVFETAGIVDLADLAQMDIRTTKDLLKGVVSIPQEQRDAVGRLLKLLLINQDT